MLQNLKQIIAFYSQQHHINIILATNASELNRWASAEGILIGIPTQEDSTFGANFEGKVVYHNDKEIAKQGENFIIFLIGLNDSETIKNILDETIPLMAKKLRRQQISQFLSLTNTIKNEIIRDREAQIRSDNWEVEKLSQRIIELTRKMEAERHMLSFFSETEERLKNKMLRIFVEMQRLIPHSYSNFRLLGNSIIGTTRPIVITYENFDYHFSPYEIEINILEGKLSITGGSDLEGCIHPHVKIDNICWGNIAPTIQKTLGQMELSGVFLLTHEFLSKYNPDDPFLRIERWDPNWIDDYEDEEYCSFCDCYGHSTDYCDYCFWCEICQEYVDHSTENCPEREEEEVIDEAAA